MIICIDFDDTIHDRKHPAEGRKMGPPMPGAVDALQDLYDRYHVIIHSTMANSPSGRKAIVDWLEYYDIDYHEIVAKPAADYYIDDRAIAFTTWKNVKKKLGIE